MDIKRIERVVGTSAAATAQTVSTPVGAKRVLEHVTVKYSAAPTHAGATVTLNSGAGATYDTQLAASAANAQTYSFVPTIPIPLDDDDVIDVLAPSGGGVITSSVTIYTSLVE